MNENNKKYAVIYADPPWEYRHKVTGRGGARCSFTSLQNNEHRRPKEHEASN